MSRTSKSPSAVDLVDPLRYRFHDLDSILSSLAASRAAALRPSEEGRGLRSKGNLLELDLFSVLFTIGALLGVLLVFWSVWSIFLLLTLGASV